MKSKIWICAVVLIIASQPIFADDIPCLDSLKLGIADAAVDYRPWNWYFVGLGAGLGVTATLFLIDDLYYENPDLAESILVGAGIVSYAVYIPAFFLPNREKIESPPGKNVDIECYRNGFKRRARWKNVGAVFLGEATASAISYVASMVLFVYYMGGYY